MTYTYVIMGISRAAFDEIAEKMRAADYRHAFGSDGEIDMHGIAVKTFEPQSKAVAELMESQELSAPAVMRAALAHYQLHCRRIHAGETCVYSGDQARAAEFAGPMVATATG